MVEQSNIFYELLTKKGIVMAISPKNKKSESKSAGTKIASTRIVTTKHATVQINVVKNKSKKSSPKKIKVVSGFERYKMIEHLPAHRGGPV
jgi:hypothetical protein